MTTPWPSLFPALCRMMIMTMRLTLHSPISAPSYKSKSIRNPLTLLLTEVDESTLPDSVSVSTGSDLFPRALPSPDPLRTLSSLSSANRSLTRFSSSHSIDHSIDPRMATSSAPWRPSPAIPGIPEVTSQDHYLQELTPSISILPDSSHTTVRPQPTPSFSVAVRSPELPSRSSEPTVKSAVSKNDLMNLAKHMADICSVAGAMQLAPHSPPPSRSRSPSPKVAMDEVLCVTDCISTRFECVF